MAKRSGYWTGKRLIELRVLSRSMTMKELQAHFGRSDLDILQAQRFEVNKRRLKMPPTKEMIDGRNITITRLAPGYAENARVPSIIWAGH